MKTALFFFACVSILVLTGTAQTPKPAPKTVALNPKDLKCTGALGPVSRILLDLLYGAFPPIMLEINPPKPKPQKQDNGLLNGVTGTVAGLVDALLGNCFSVLLRQILTLLFSGMSTPGNQKTNIANGLFGQNA